MCVFFLALSPYRKTMRDGKSASKPNPHIFAQLSRRRKQLVACCKKLFLKVDKIAVKKAWQSTKGHRREAPPSSGCLHSDVGALCCWYRPQHGRDQS